MYDIDYLETPQQSSQSSLIPNKNSISQIKLPGKFLEQILALPKDVLTPQEKLLYLRLFFFQTMNISSNGRYYAEVSLSHLAKEISAHRSTVSRLIKNLQKKQFLDKVINRLEDGSSDRARIEVSAPDWFKDTLCCYKDTDKKQNLFLSLSKELFIFIPNKKIKTIFRLTTTVSAKLLYFRLFLESYKNKVKNKKENLECFVQFSRLVKKISLIKRTISSAIQSLQKEGVIKVERLLFNWKIELPSEIIDFQASKILLERPYQSPGAKMRPPGIKMLPHNRKRKIEKTRSEKIFKKNDFSVKKESKFSSQNYKFSESDVLFLQKAAERSFVKSEINEIFQKIQNKPFWSRVFFRSRKAFMNYLVKILKYEKTQESDIVGTQKLKILAKKNRIRKRIKESPPPLRSLLQKLSVSDWKKFPEYMLDDIGIELRGKEVFFAHKTLFFKQYLKERGVYSLFEKHYSKLGYKLSVV